MATSSIASIDALLVPIAGPLPGGEDIQLAPEWLAIKAARESDDGVTTGGRRESKTANWPLVRELAANALTTKSKDLCLAVWLTEAKIRLEGLAGLRDGVRLLSGLLVNFWDRGLYPPLVDDDPQFRARQLEWLSTKMPDLLLEIPLTGRADRGVNYSYLKYRESRQVGFEKDTKDADGNVIESKQKARATALEAQKTSGEMFEEAVRATPRAFFETLTSDLSKVQEATRELESAIAARFNVSDSPDLATAGEALGDLQTVLNRILKVKREAEPDRQVAPGPTPDGGTAAETQSALGARRFQRPGWGNIDGGLTLGASWEHARALVQSGQVREGLTEMSCLAAQEHGRSRFLRKLTLAEICLDNQREPVGLLILEELAKEIENLHLAAWESPELVARVWGLLYRQYRNSNDKAERAAELWTQLCRLDPWQGLIWGEG